MATGSAEEQLRLMDRIFNVVHQRSDLTALFLEGGTRAFMKLHEG
jgi:hypothetical protein